MTSLRVIRVGTFARSGAISGAASALVFVVVHDIFISDIWFSLIVMVLAGALCGMCLGWSFGVMIPAPSLSQWTKYNAVFVGMLFALGLASVIVFEPRTTLAVLIEENEPPGDLIAAALPMTAVFTIAAAAVIARLFGRTWTHFGVASITSVVLVALLGLNVSVIGLVDIPTDSLHLVAELFALILTLDVVFAVGFALLQRGAWSRSQA